MGIKSVAAIAAAVLTVPASAAGSPPVVSTVREIAGQSPFAHHKSCNVSTVWGTSPGDKEADPYLAVNPVNPQNRIAAWMDSTRATIDTAYTTDGGRSWHVVKPRGIDNCTGNNTNQWEASDSDRIAFGPDGIAYLSILTWAHYARKPLSKYVSVMHVSVSADGGRSWSAPALVSGPGSVADSPMVAADPQRPGVAYEIWANQSYGLPVGARGASSLNFQVTYDHGATWSTPAAIATSPVSGNPFGSPQLSVLSDGTLVATSSLGNRDGTSNELSWRSADHGRTWHGPALIRVASAGATPALCGHAVLGGTSSAASGQQQVLNGRSVLLITDDGAAEKTGAAQLVLSRSDDGGITWHSRTVFRTGQPVILASIAVSRRQLGLVFDQIGTGKIDCAASTIPVRSQFAVAPLPGDGKVVFGQPVTLGARWWNLTSGLRAARYYFFGYYQALAAIPGGFTAITAQGRPLAPDGPALTGQNGVITADVSTTGT